MSVLSCDDAAGRWHRRWHRSVIAAIAECVLMSALAVPLIGVTSALARDGAISSMFLVFKTGVSSDPAQAGSIPVRLREPGRVRTVGATKYSWMHARDSTRIRSTTASSSCLSCSGEPATARSILPRTPARR